MKAIPKLSLAKLAAGKLGVRFDEELEKVLRDIADPAAADTARVITLKVKITPEGGTDNELAKLRWSVGKQLAARTGDAALHLALYQGKPCAFTSNPKQLGIVGFSTLADIVAE